MSDKKDDKEERLIIAARKGDLDAVLVSFHSAFIIALGCYLVFSFTK